MPGLTFSNELISRDEGMHTDFAVLLYSYLENKLSQSQIELIVREAIEIEIRFITSSLKCNLMQHNLKYTIMNSPHMLILHYS